MSRLVAGSGFALDFDESRLADGFVSDAFTVQPAAGALAAGTGGVTIDRTVGGRWHRTTLSYGATGSGSALNVRFDGLTDQDPSGALRYRIEGAAVSLSATTLDRLGARLFQGITEIVGADGDDSVYMGVPAGRTFTGGAGTDRAIYGADPRRYVLRDGAYQAETPVVVALSADRYAVVSSSGVDLLTGVEAITIDGRTTSLAAAAFDALGYLAANRDLAAAFGADPLAGARHYALYGRNERRPTAGFDAYAYLGSNPDLLLGYGVDAAAAQRHYLTSGLREGRPTTGFDPYAYLAANPDLLAAYGANPVAALTHYRLYGLAEGRSSAGFDGLSYLAANPDLAGAYGFNPAAGAWHYAAYGHAEGRSPRFDTAAYLAANPDVAAASGGDLTTAMRHYVLYGRSEGRPLSVPPTAARAADPLAPAGLLAAAGGV